jgi:hypothetical protein
MTAAALLRKNGHSAADILARLEDGHMWTAPMPLENAAGLRVGHIKTDGERVSLSACGSAYGAPRVGLEAAAVEALGPMPPVLANDWVTGMTQTLERHGYRVSCGAVARSRG